MGNARDFIIENGILKKYVGPGGDVVIPEDVKCIGDHAFGGCHDLTGVVIPASVTHIGQWAFASCRSLVNAEVPYGMKSIGDYAFAQSNLVHVTIPGSVTTIGKEVFSWCRNLKSVIIPEYVQSIDDEAFNSILSTHLQLVTPHIPFDSLYAPEVKRAAVLGFLNNQDMYTNAAIVDAYRKYTISQRKKLLPTVFSLDMVQALVFYAENKKCTSANFESEYMEPAQKANAINCVAYLMDWKNANIRSAKIEKATERKLTQDPFNAADMKKLWDYESMEDGTLMITSYKGSETEVFVPERIGKTPVTRLDDGVFSSKTKTGRSKTKKQVDALQSILAVHIPDSVTSIGNGVFSECKNLADTDGFVIVRGVLDSYFGSGGDLELPEGITSIGAKVFWGCQTLTSITLPDSLISIGDWAFWNCRSMESVVFGKGITSIGNGAFYGCESLTSIALPKSVTNIGCEAFYDCANLASVEISADVISIGADAFNWCKKLADADGFVIVCGTLYQYYGSVSDVFVPRSVTKISNMAFIGLNTLSSVVIPDSVMCIGNEAFAACKNLSSIIIPSSVTSIDDSAFEGCENVSIHAPAGSYAETHAKEHNIPFVTE